MGVVPKERPVPSGPLASLVDLDASPDTMGVAPGTTGAVAT